MEKKRIDFTADATPTISDYQTKWAAIFGPYPNARMFWIDEEGNWVQWMQQPKFTISAGRIESISWDLGAEMTGFIILS